MVFKIKILKDISKIIKLLKQNLELSDEESKIFLYIIIEGMKSIKEISDHYGIPINYCKKLIVSLISKNMLLEYSQDLYEVFHPRFAVINRYKRLCEKKNLEFKKNSLIDSLGLLLEHPYDIARTK